MKDLNMVPVELWEDDEFKAEWHNRISSLKADLVLETEEIIGAIWAFKKR